ncbi:tetrapyrrole biosynthesis, uroporphyrinogen III synthase [Phlyctochytrium arcticum]|nr:tetrapyrrole biosynthesis, uroporphyrinogen III synthase [Phlyctochytrium arcticum]
MGDCTTKPVVLLLRAKSDRGEDKYEKAFSSAYRTIHVPVLSSAAVNQDELLQTIKKKAIDYAGVILTSSAASESWSEAWASLDDTSVQDKETANLWLTKPFFVVGHGTGERMTKIGFDTKGENSGTAINLSAFIADSMHDSGDRRPLLFLAGDKARDVLPTQLHNADIALQKLIVYATEPSPTFAHDLARATASEDPRWIVFFSPSGVDVALTELKQQKWWDSVSVASIGPTTTDHLLQLDVAVDAQAADPDAISLREAIEAKSTQMTPEARQAGSTTS